MRLILIILFSAFGAVPAWAFTANNNLNVSVTVPPTVQLLVSNMDFGVSSNPQAVLTATAGIQVNMVAGQIYNITLDAGLHFFAERRIDDGAGHFRSYHLYKDAGHSQLWGDSDYAGSYAAGTSLATTGTGTWQSFTVHGSSPAHTAAANPPGTYADTVTVTIHY